MTLEGVVTNVTKFGAFVDIGVHQDGLVHISELSNRYVQDPERGCEGRPDREGAGPERRPEDQAHRAVHEDAAVAQIAAAARAASEAQSLASGPGGKVQSSLIVTAPRRWLRSGSGPPSTRY